MGLVPVGTEWIVIGIVLVALLLWGPRKIPELARALGRARREYEEAKRGATATVREVSEVGSELLDVARALGVETAGRTRDEIAKEIIERAKAAGS